MGTVRVMFRPRSQSHVVPVRLRRRAFFEGVFDMSALSMLSGHLSVSTAARVSAGQIAVALETGHLSAIGDSHARALVAGVFSEHDPDLILRATSEAGGTPATANALYLESLADGMPCCPGWERLMSEIL